MAGPPLLIAQISDLHIKPPGELAYRCVDTAAALRRCIATLNALSPRPALVVISGDLADGATPDEYDHLKVLLADLQVPFAAIPGNHDDRVRLRAALPDQGYADAGPALNLLRRVGEVDLLLLDSTVPGAAHGELDAGTLQWLDTTLAQSTGRPALLFVHHPPFLTGIGHMDGITLRNASALADVVGRHPRLRLVAAGHVHRAMLTQFAGIPATVCPVATHAVALDLEDRLMPSFRIEPAAFHLHAWFPDDGFGAVVTHQVPVGDFDPPRPFAGGT